MRWFSTRGACSCLSLVLGAFCLLNPAHARDSSFSVEPHAYGGARGNEPKAQNVVRTFQAWGNPSVGDDSSFDAWSVQLHFEGETLGRRDVSFDIDRAWVRSGSFTFGRVHPWDLSGSLEAHRPWGYSQHISDLDLRPCQRRVREDSPRSVSKIRRVEHGKDERRAFSAWRRFQFRPSKRLLERG